MYVKNKYSLKKQQKIFLLKGIPTSCFDRNSFVGTGDKVAALGGIGNVTDHT